MDKTVISTIKVTLTVLAILAALYVLIILGPVFLTLIISLYIALALEPVVKHFKKATLFNTKISRGLAVAITYILTFLIIILIFTIGVPPVINQAQKLVANLGTILSEIPILETFDISVDQILPQLTQASDQILAKTVSIFSNLIGVLSILFLSVYMSLDWENLKRRGAGLFKGKVQEKIAGTIDQVETNVGYWAKGQIFLMLAIGLLSFFGLLILGIDYPLALGLIAGMLEIVPIIGPIISTVLAGIVGFSVSPAKGLMAVALFFLIQQLENSFLVPKIMQKVSGFSPLVVLVAVLVGAKFLGTIGVVLAVPITMTLVIIMKKALGSE